MRELSKSVRATYYREYYAKNPDKMLAKRIKQKEYLREYQRKYRLENLAKEKERQEQYEKTEKRKQYKRAYWAKMTVEQKAERNERNKAWLRNHPGRRKEWHMRNRYGIELSEKEAMWAQQGGKCPICSVMLVEVKCKEQGVIDHDHITGKVRGILCHECNRSLGGFKDDTNRLRRALAYLENSVIAVNLAEREGLPAGKLSTCR